LPIKLNPVGGGGTDFRPPFEYLESEDIIPAAAIYLTDGECYSFPEEPDYPVMWIIDNKRTADPPFGEVIRI